MSQLTHHHEQDESTVVARILVTVHKSIDKRFPSMVNKSRQFSKTVFSQENTAAGDDIKPGIAVDSPQLMLRQDQPTGRDEGTAFMSKRMISENKPSPSDEIEFDEQPYEASQHTNVSDFYQLNSSPRLYGLVGGIAFILGAAVVIYLLSS